LTCDVIRVGLFYVDVPTVELSLDGDFRVDDSVNFLRHDPQDDVGCSCALMPS